MSSFLSHHQVALYRTFVSCHGAITSVVSVVLPLHIKIEGSRQETHELRGVGSLLQMFHELNGIAHDLR